MKFHIITAMYNVDEWIEENIQQLKAQSFKNFQMILVDDQSTDKTVELVRHAIQDDSRFQLIINSQKKYKTRNIVEAIDATQADDEDVIILVDGDDRLAHKDALKTLARIYQQQSCWMTYGSYTNSAGIRPTTCRAYDLNTINKNCFRQKKWLASHLKTFKYKLWKKLSMDIFHITSSEINQALTRSLFKLQFRRWYHWRDIKTENLHDISGKYIRRIDDKAFSYPMLEMSGDKAYFVDEILYIFHTERTPYHGPDQNYGKNRSEKWHTRLIRDILIHKKKYNRLKQL
jgi:glycosyltransferase involved in cell wall biosynthesis